MQEALRYNFHSVRKNHIILVPYVAGVWRNKGSSFPQNARERQETYLAS